MLCSLLFCRDIDGRIWGLVTINSGHMASCFLECDSICPWVLAAILQCGFMAIMIWKVLRRCSITIFNGVIVVSCMLPSAMFAVEVVIFSMSCVNGILRIFVAPHLMVDRFI